MAAFANVEVADLFKEGPFVIASLEENVAASETKRYDAVLVGILTDQTKSVRDRFDIFRERVNVRYMTCVNVENISGDLNFVKLLHLSRDLADFLIGIGFGSKVDVQEQKQLCIEYFTDKQTQERLERQASLLCFSEQDTSTPDMHSGSRKKDVLELLESQKDEKCVILKPGMRTGGYISSFVHGPNLFYVHVNYESEILHDLMYAINAEDLPSLRSRPQRGDSVAARLDTMGNAMCRGMVVEILENNDMKIYFRDYGCHKIIKLKDLKFLPERYELVIPLAHPVKLIPSEANRISRQMHPMFSDILNKKELELDILSQENGFSYINATYNGIKIIDFVQQEMYKHSPQYETLSLKPGNQRNVLISWVDTSGKSPWSFSVQLEEYLPRVELLMREIQTECTTKSIPPITSVQPGMPIVATFNDDGNWYRAQVLESNNTCVKVQYVDYGNCDVIPWSKTRKMRGDFVLSLPSQALQCRLSGVDTIEKAAIRFEEKYASKSYLMKVDTQLNTGEYLVKLFDINQKDGMDISINLALQSQQEQRNMSPSFTSATSDELVGPKLMPPIPEHVKPVRDAHLNRDPVWLRQSVAGFDIPGLPEQRSDPKLKGQSSGKFSSLVDALDEKVETREEIPSSKRVKKHQDTQEDWGDGRPPVYVTEDTWDHVLPRSNTSSQAKLRKEEPQHGSDQDRWQHDKFFELERAFELKEEKQQQKHAYKTNGGSRKIDNSNSGSASAQASSYSFQKNVPNEVFVVPKPKLKYPPLKLSPGMKKIKVMASFIKTPWQFSVQVQDNLSEFRTMTKRIEVLCRHGGLAVDVLPKELDPGDACIAKFVDNKWHRAQVIEVIEDKVRLKLIDTGHISIFNIYTQVKAAAMELVNLPVQSFDCFLRGTAPKDGEQWNQNEIQNFQDMITKSKIELDIIAVDIDGLYNVVGYDNNNCINTQFGASIESLERHKSIARMELQNLEATDEAFIVWFNNPLNFYVRLASRAVQEDNIHKFIQDVADRCPTLHTVEKGDLVIARFPHDSKFYRGIVTATKDEQAKIFRVDMGDTRICDFNRVRALPEMLMSVPGFAVLCGIADIKPTLGSDWPPRMPEIDRVFQACETFLLMPVSCDETGKIMVHLMSPDRMFRVADELIKEGVAKREEHPPAVESSLQVGSTCDVVVSFNEGLRFFVYPSSKIAEVSKLQIDLQALSLENAEEETRPGKIAAAKSTDDGQWYRALALGCPTQTGVKVIFLDYGNICIPRTIKRLPTDITNVAPYAVECQLAIKPPDNKETFHPEVVEIFKKFVFEENDGEVTIKIYEKTGTDILIVDILSPSQESLVDILHDVRLVERTYTEAYMSYAISANKFYIHEVCKEDRLHKIENELTTLELTKLKTIKEGVRCVAKFEDDGAYYRAKIISVIDTSVKVFFCDYGNTAIVSELKTLPLHLAVMSDVARECSLLATSDHVESEFNARALDGTTKYQVKLHNTSSEKWKVSLYVNGEQLFQVTDEPLPKEATVDVTVSHFVSHDDFWLHKLSEEPALVELEVQLMELMSEHLSYVCEGLVCAGKVGANGPWCRVCVLDNEKVHFMDYGHVGEVVQFKELTDELVELPPFATHCQLNVSKLIEHEIHEVERLLKQQGALYQAEFKDTTKSKTTVNLYIDGKNITDFTTPIEADNREFVDFIVSGYRSCFEFYIQLRQNIEKLDHLCACLADENFFEVLDKVEEGMICVTKYTETDSWHRCLVTYTSTNTTGVFLIDYGIAILNATEFRGIPDSIKKIPPMAYQCYLKLESNNQIMNLDQVNLILNDPRRPVFQTDSGLSHSAAGMAHGISVFRNKINILNLLQEVEVNVSQKSEKVRLQNYCDNVAQEFVVDTLEYVELDSSNEEDESERSSSQASVHTRSNCTPSSQASVHTRSNCTLSGEEETSSESQEYTAGKEENSLDGAQEDLSESFDEKGGEEEEKLSENMDDQEVEEEEDFDDQEDENLSQNEVNSEGENEEKIANNSDEKVEVASSGNNESIFVSDDEEMFNNNGNDMDSMEPLEEHETVSEPCLPLVEGDNLEEDTSKLETIDESLELRTEDHQSEKESTQKLMKVASGVENVTMEIEISEVQSEKDTPQKPTVTGNDMKRDNKVRMSTVDFIMQNIRSTQSTPISEEILQNTPICEEILQNTPISEEILQNTPICEEILQTTPISEEILQNTPISEEMLQNTPISEEILQNTPISEKILQTTPISEEILQNTPIPEEILHNMPVPEETVKHVKENTEETTQETEDKSIYLTPEQGTSGESNTSVYCTPQSSARRSLIPLRTSSRTPLPKVIREENKVTPKSDDKTERGKSVFQKLPKNVQK